MRNTIIYITAAAALLTSATTFAYAHDDKKRGHNRGPNIEHMLERFDTNNDGGISIEEVKTYQTGLFTRVDADSDSSLTEEEFAMIGDILKSEREANKPEGEQTKMADRKGDGKQKGGKGKDRKMGDRVDARFESGRGFDRLDADESGTVSLEEFTTMTDRIADRMFDRMDRNEDGLINMDDMRKRRG